MSEITKNLVCPECNLNIWEGDFIDEGYETHFDKIFIVKEYHGYCTGCGKDFTYKEKYEFLGYYDLKEDKEDD